MPGFVYLLEIFGQFIINFKELFSKLINCKKFWGEFFVNLARSLYSLFVVFLYNFTEFFSNL